MPVCLPASQPSCCAPLRAFLAREGLARFCTAPYEPPRGSNLGDAFRHLTNYALNKQNTASYVFAGCGWEWSGRGRGGRGQQQVAHLGARGPHAAGGARLGGFVGAGAWRTAGCFLHGPMLLRNTLLPALFNGSASHSPAADCPAHL